MDLECFDSMIWLHPLHPSRSIYHICFSCSVAPTSKGKNSDLLSRQSTDMLLQSLHCIAMIAHAQNLQLWWHCFLTTSGYDATLTPVITLQLSHKWPMAFTCFQDLYMKWKAFFGNNYSKTNNLYQPSANCLTKGDKRSSPAQLVSQSTSSTSPNVHQHDANMISTLHYALICVRFNAFQPTHHQTNSTKPFIIKKHAPDAGHTSIESKIESIREFIVFQGFLQISTPQAIRVAQLRPRGSSSDSLDPTSCWAHSAPQSHGCDWDVGAAPHGERGWVMGAWKKSLAGCIGSWPKSYFGGRLKVERSTKLGDVNSIAQSNGWYKWYFHIYLLILDHTGWWAAELGFEAREAIHLAKHVHVLISYISFSMHLCFPCELYPIPNSRLAAWPSDLG